MANETRYLYSINPKKVIKFLSGNIMKPPIRVSKSLRLTKEEVLDCLKYGSVYRRFANEGKIERVTTLNIDRLHNEKFMTEEEYYKMMTTKESDDNRGTVITEEVPEVKEESDIEEVKEESHEENDEVVETVEQSDSIEEEAVVEEETSEAEEVFENTGDVVEESVAEEAVVESESTNSSETEQTVEQSTNKQQYYHSKNYGGKNKHRH